MHGDLGLDASTLLVATGTRQLTGGGDAAAAPGGGNLGFGFGGGGGGEGKRGGDGGEGGGDCKDTNTAQC